MVKSTPLRRKRLPRPSHTENPELAGSDRGPELTHEIRQARSETYSLCPVVAAPSTPTYVGIRRAPRPPASPGTFHSRRCRKVGDSSRPTPGLTVEPPIRRITSQTASWRTMSL